MSDPEEDAEGPAVPLGEGETVEGAPLARVTSRLHYAIGKSEVIRREGETVIRTPDGPQELASVLETTDEVYFDTRQAFESAVRDVIGIGPIPTAETSEETDKEEKAEMSEESGEPEEAEESEVTEETENAETTEE